MLLNPLSNKRVRMAAAAKHTLKPNLLIASESLMMYTFIYFGEFGTRWQLGENTVLTSLCWILLPYLLIFNFGNRMKFFTRIVKSLPPVKWMGLEYIAISPLLRMESRLDGPIFLLAERLSSVSREVDHIHVEYRWNFLRKKCCSAEGCSHPCWHRCSPTVSYLN